MSTLAIFTGDMTKAQYESLRREVNWERQQPHGGVFHCASFDDEGHVHVADVWESTEALNAFVAERLAPAMQKLKLPMPSVDLYAVHNINAYKSIERHLI